MISTRILFYKVTMYSGNYETVSRWVRFRLRVAHVLIDISVKTKSLRKKSSQSQN